MTTTATKSALKVKLKAKLKQAQAMMAWAIKSEDARRINAMLDLARSEPGVPILPDQLDRDPFLFNVPNGTLDLKTGKLREHRREDHITKLCPVEYRPDAPRPRWEQFVEEIFEGKARLIAFVQRLFGHCLTGSVSEQILAILWGTGANGKSTLINAVLEVMGDDYALKAPRDLLMARKGDSHPTMTARLFGRRLAVCVESAEGGRLDEPLVKELTGGDPITARRMREDYWTFQPQHKVMLVTNHKPGVRGTDHAIWRRLALIPFTATFGDDRQDKELPARLRQESPGILAWMVEGCMEWQRLGLDLPDEVRAATKQYRDSQDLVGSFLAERCVTGADHSIKASQLYAAFKLWCEAAGERPCSRDRLGDAMTERGMERYTSNGTRYRGVALRDETTENDLPQW